MAYIGTSSSVADLTRTQLRYQQFSGNGVTTTFTLSQSVSTTVDLEVFVENVQQEPIVAFVASGTSLSFTEAPPSGTNNIYVVYRQYSVPYVSIADGTITNAKLAQNIKIFTADNFVANGTGTTFVLSDTPADANTIYVSIDGVVQRAPENYSLSANTLILTSAPSSSANVHVRHLGIRTTTSVFEPLASSIKTAAIADGAITSAKMASNSVQTVHIVNSAVTPIKLSQPLTQGTANSSISGSTFVDFTNIPSWVKRITVLFGGVSTTGGSVVLVQVGAGSVVATGYEGTQSTVIASTSSTTNYTAGFAVGFAAAAAIVRGALTLALIDSNSWTAFGVTSRSEGSQSSFFAGGITLAGTLDRIRITTVSGTDTFDAGTINILYE